MGLGARGPRLQSPWFLSGSENFGLTLRPLSLRPPEEIILEVAAESLIRGTGVLLGALFGGRSREKKAPFRRSGTGRGARGHRETQPLSCEARGAGLPLARPAAAQSGRGGGSRVRRRCPSPPVLKSGARTPGRAPRRTFPRQPTRTAARLPGSPFSGTSSLGSGALALQDHSPMLIWWHRFRTVSDGGGRNPWKIRSEPLLTFQWPRTSFLMLETKGNARTRARTHAHGRGSGRVCVSGRGRVNIDYVPWKSQSFSGSLIT